MLKFALSGVAITGTETAVLAVGCVVAFVVSLAAIRFLMGYVKRHNFTFFGIYRIVLGLVVLAVAAVTAMMEQLMILSKPLAPARGFSCAHPPGVL
mgnify:CR=1 FL=1